MINHSNSNNCGWIFDEKSKTFQVVALKRIKMNSQITISYKTNMSNLDSFLVYGFVQDPNPIFETIIRVEVEKVFDEPEYKERL